MLIHHPRSTPQLHRDFLDRAVSILAADSRVVGVAAAGSYSADLMDDYSDLDLVVVCEGASFDEVMQSRKQVASKLGRLVAAFTGEHVGEPRLLICLYGPPALHVDLKFVRIEDLKDRVDQPTVLWERDVRLTEALAHGSEHFPRPTTSGSKIDSGCGCTTAPRRLPAENCRRRWTSSRVVRAWSAWA